MAEHFYRQRSGRQRHFEVKERSKITFSAAHSKTPMLSNSTDGPGPSTPESVSQYEQQCVRDQGAITGSPRWIHLTYRYSGDEWITWIYP